MLCWGVIQGQLGVTFIHYMAEVKAGLVLELPPEAEQLDLKPGDKVPVQLTFSDLRADLHEKGHVSVMGKYAFISCGSDEFAVKKRDEIKREDPARWTY